MSEEEDNELTEEGEQALKSVAKGAGIAFIGLIFSKIFGYGYNIIAARFLGPDGYGIISLAGALVSFASVFCILGLNHGIRRYVPFYRGKNNREKVRGTVFSGLKITSVATILVTVLLFFSSDFLATSVFNEPHAALIFKIFSLGLPFYVFLRSLTSITDAFKKMKYRVISQDFIWKGLRVFFIAIFVVFMGYDVLGAAYAYILSYSAAFIVALYFFVKKIFPRVKDAVSQPNYKELLTYSWPLLFVSVMGIVLSKTDQIMLGYFLDSSQVGIYKSALLIAAVLAIVLTALRRILLPVLSDLLGKDKKQEFTKTFRTATKWSFTATLPLFTVMVLFAPRVLKLIFGEEYTAGAVALSILAVTYFTKACFGLSSSLLKSLEKTKLILVATVSSGLLNVILNYLLIPRFGMEGAATAYLLSIVLMYALYLFWSNRYLEANPIKPSLIKPILATAGSTTFTYLLFKQLISPVSLWMLPVAFIIFIGLYTFLFLILGGIEQEDLLILKSIERKSGMRIKWLRNLIKKFI